MAIEAAKRHGDIEIVSAGDVSNIEGLEDIIQPLPEMLQRPLLYKDYAEPVNNKPFYYNIPSKKRKRR